MLRSHQNQTGSRPCRQAKDDHQDQRHGGTDSRAPREESTHNLPGRSKGEEGQGSKPQGHDYEKKKEDRFLAAVVGRHCGQAAHAYYVSFAGL